MMSVKTYPGADMYIDHNLVEEITNSEDVMNTSEHYTKNID